MESTDIVGTVPVRESKCETCPFREGSRLNRLAPYLAATALTEKSRICHSTGPANAIHENPPDPEPRVCRGSRDVQLQAFHMLGVLEEPTDEAWVKALKNLGGSGIGSRTETQRSGHVVPDNAKTGPKRELGECSAPPAADSNWIPGPWDQPLM